MPVTACSGHCVTLDSWISVDAALTKAKDSDSPELSATTVCVVDENLKR